MESVYPPHFYVIPYVYGIDWVWVYMDEIQYMDFNIFRTMMVSFTEMSGYIIVILFVDAPQVALESVH